MSAAPAAIRTAPIPGGRFRPELELLFAATSGPLTPLRSRRITALLDHSLDWDFLLEFADQHGLTSLFFWVAQNFPDHISPHLLRRLNSGYQANARKNLMLCHMLLEVQALLESEGVPSIAFKGPALAATLYGEVALREFSDLDILIHPDDVQRARSILMKNGFAPTSDFPQSHQRSYLKSANELAFDRGPHRNILELQWKIAPAFYAFEFDVEDLFRRAVFASADGLHCRTLRPEDLLLVLCAHGAKHVWARLAWICDVAWLLQRQNLDWSEILDRAHPLGLQRILLVTLALARAFFQISLPPQLPQEINSDRDVQRVSRAVEKNILHGQMVDTTRRDYFLLMCRLRERCRDRFRFLARLAFTPGAGEWSSISLPRALWPAYFFLRPIRLMRKLYQA